MKSRRKAIHAELVRESKDNPGYFRYNITIKEKDGKQHIVPAYGKDMQDAIERLLWNERYSNISSKKGTATIVTASLLSVVVFASILASEHNQPLWILGALGIPIVFSFTLQYIEKYLKKR